MPEFSRPAGPAPLRPGSEAPGPFFARKRKVTIGRCPGGPPAIVRTASVKLDPIDTLARLVAIPSVNPMERPVSDPTFCEGRLTEYLEATLKQMGLAARRQVVAPGRENVVARLDGDRPPDHGGAVLMWEAHQDTVPVDGMTVEPFAAEVRGGRLYGRGACDTKGGMAAMLAAVARLAAERPRGMPTILLCCTVNEEYGFSGASTLTELWTQGPGEIVPRRPDAAVVAEPTDLAVVVAHKGVVRWRCHAPGRAVHGAHPEQGENAVYRMAHALVQIQRYAVQRVGSLASHPLCGRATLSVGLIRGGVSVNTVPDRCTIEVDRRLPPGEDPEQAQRHLIDYLAGEGELGFPLEHEPAFTCGLPLSDEGNGPLADRLAATASQIAGDCRKVGVPYATNAAFFAAAGVPSVVFGPGSIEQAHTKDEWVAVDQVERAAEIYYRFARTFG